MKLLDLKSILAEMAFDNKTAAAGTVGFNNSQLSDPYIQKAIQYISQHSGKSTKDIADIITAQVNKMGDTAKLVPSLYQTMMKNAIESEVFNLMWRGVPEDTEVAKIRRMMGMGDDRKPVGNDPVDVKFSDRMFMQLVRYIKADHDEFFPLRGFVDRRVQMNEDWVITPSQNPAYSKYNSIDTAAATPSGVFLFNRHFCQKLLDYASLKGLKGNGNKYKSNGGPIPDQYAYIEFLIIHELMHFSNDDFYYQHIIPDANPTIINWVGDFRSNYILVKNGYAQLPIGLYNDAINYDRQSEYIQMYRIVEAEMKKLNKDDQEKVKGEMDGQSDDHEPGQGEGKANQKAAGEAKGKSAGDIDKNAERVEKDVSDSKDAAEPAEPGQQGDPGKGESGSEGGAGQKDANQEIDYNKVAPSFSWQQIAKKFVGSASPKTLETYAKPHKRGATSADLIRQTGAGAIKPAEKLSEHVDISLMFVVDSSGSMSDAIARAYSNIAALLKQPQFKNSDCIIARFSSDYDLHKGNFAKNKAAKVGSLADKPTKYETTMQAVFNSHMGYSTNFKGQLVAEIQYALKNKYNVLIFSDSDIFSSAENLKNLKALAAMAPRNVFILFDKRETYIRWRSTPGSFTTPNISHM